MTTASAESQRLSEMFPDFFLDWKERFLTKKGNERKGYPPLSWWKEQDPQIARHVRRTGKPPKPRAKKPRAIRLPSLDEMLIGKTTPVEIGRAKMVARTHPHYLDHLDHRDARIRVYESNTLRLAKAREAKRLHRLQTVEGPLRRPFGPQLP